MGARDRCLTPSGGIISRTRHAAGSKTRGKSSRWAAPAPPKIDPRFRLSSRGDGAGLTMRPSRRPTVTRNGRASIVAWFPQTPQPDAHHTHYRIRRICQAMIVTRLRPRCYRAHPSARLSRVRPRTTTKQQVQFFPPFPASAPIFERLFPAIMLLFLARMHHGPHQSVCQSVCQSVSQSPLERDFFDEPLAEVFTCNLHWGSARLTGRGVRKNVAVGHGNNLFRPTMSTA